MKRFLVLPLIAALPSLALADAATPVVTDVYARSANPKSGAVLVSIHNPGTTECRLIGASSPAADSVMLHGVRVENSMMVMFEIEGGLPIPPGGDLMMEGSGDHIMLMGLKTPLKDGDSIDVTLDLGPCGQVPLTAKVDNVRGTAAPHGGGATMQHGTMLPPGHMAH